MASKIAAMREITVLEVLLASMKKKSGEVARAIGMHRVRFSEKLHGRGSSPFTVEEIVKIADYLGVSPEVLATNVTPEDIIAVANRNRDMDQMRDVVLRVCPDWKKSNVEPPDLDERVAWLIDCGVNPEELSAMPAQEMAKLWAKYHAQFRKKTKAALDEEKRAAAEDDGDEEEA
ncbi:MAG: helix-turn-helix transcriptional regulator [Elusimicrobiota bacterium]|jgi:plasmid maintenance system antidote protein VapI